MSNSISLYFILVVINLICVMINVRFNNIYGIIFSSTIGIICLFALLVSIIKN